MNEKQFLRVTSSAILGTHIPFGVEIRFLSRPWAGETSGKKIRLSHPKHGVMESLHLLNHEVVHIMLDHVSRGKRMVGTESAMGWTLWNLAADDVVRRVLKEAYQSNWSGYLGSYGKKLMPFLDSEVDLSVLEGYPQDAPVEVLYRWLLEKEPYVFVRRLAGKRGYAERRLMLRDGRGTHSFKVRESFDRREPSGFKGDFGEKGRGFHKGDLRREWEWCEKGGITFERELSCYLETFSVGRGEYYTFLVPNKRMLALDYPLALPARARKAVSCLVAVDTSGSVSSHELSRFLSVLRENSSILNMDLLFCDAEVQEVVGLRDADPDAVKRRLRKVSVRGGGGTSYEPVFEYFFVHQQRYSLLIYFTDLFCSFPQRHPPRVLWVVQLNRHTVDREVPYGRIVWV